MFILRHAWLSLLDKHMTTGRINQVTFVREPRRRRRGAGLTKNRQHRSTASRLSYYTANLASSVKSRAADRLGVFGYKKRLNVRQSNASAPLANHFSWPRCTQRGKSKARDSQDDDRDSLVSLYFSSGRLRTNAQR